MRTALCAFVAVSLHAAGLAGVVHASLLTELPELSHYRRTICIWGRPSLHAGELLLGGSEAEVRAFFGDVRPPRAEGSSKTCLRYRFRNSDILTLLVERDVVTRTWLSRRTRLPPSCMGVAEGLSEVRGQSAWVWS